MRKRMQLPTRLPTGSALLALAKGVLNTDLGRAVVGALAHATGDTPAEVRASIERGMAAKSSRPNEVEQAEAEVLDD